MKNYIQLGICILLIISYTSNVECGNCNDCDSGCDSDCSTGCTSDCSTGCRTTCQTPCKRKCKTADCRTKCDIKEIEEPLVQKTVSLPQKDSSSKTSNVNDIKNDYNVIINPNITLTNTISNINNISVPINVTSVNMNNIRVSSSDARSSQTNITARGAEGCSSKNPPADCYRNQKQVVLIPYPQGSPPAPQPPVVMQPIVRVIQAPQPPAPPPQRIPIYVPTPVVQQVPVPTPVVQQVPVPTPVVQQVPVPTPVVQQVPVPTPVVQQIPIQIQPQQVQRISQYWYVRQPQQTVITQPQQQVIYAEQPSPCGAPGGQCGFSCANQQCGIQNQQIIPISNPLPSPCQSGGCDSRMMYALTSPYVSTNQASLYGGLNSFYSGNTVSQYGPVGSLDARNGMLQSGALYASGNGFQQFSNGRSFNQLPVGVDSYFIPNRLSGYQIQGGNSTRLQRV